MKTIFYIATILPLVLVGCVDISKEQAKTEEESIIQAAKERRREMLLYGQESGSPNPEESINSKIFGNHEWGKIFVLNEDSAYALVRMAIERRLDAAKVGKNKISDGQSKQAFEVYHRRLINSLKVHQCSIEKRGLQGMCIISHDVWNAKQKTFETVKTLQGFARRGEGYSWRPVAIDLKNSKAK